MEERSNICPSFENILSILSFASQERLQSLRHRLQDSSTVSDGLLLTMVLSMSIQNEDAQTVTGRLRNDSVDIYASDQISRRPFQDVMNEQLSQTSRLDILVNLARMYAFLVDEELCEAGLRDHAYMAALQACAASGEEDVARLQDLKAECLEKCGPHLFPNGVPSDMGTLKSVNCLYSVRHTALPRSDPIPVQGCSGTHSVSALPGSLHSFPFSGVEIPFSTDLQVSHSPTVRLVSMRSGTDSDVPICEHAVFCQNGTECCLCQPPEIRQRLNGTERCRCQPPEIEQILNDTEHSVCQPPEIRQRLNGTERPRCQTLEIEQRLNDAEHSPYQPPEIEQRLNPREAMPSSEPANNQDVTLKDNKCNISIQTHNSGQSFFKANVSAPVECSEKSESSQIVTLAKAEQAGDEVTENNMASALPGSGASPRTAASINSSVLPVDNTYPPALQVEETSPPTLPVDDTSPPALRIDNPSPSVLSVEDACRSIESHIRRFFSFVILHHPEDEKTAIRVNSTLADIGVQGGTTFCEEFSVPGHSPLTCIRDAVDNSAFTVLLLTRTFASRWEEYQTNMVLLNSIENRHRYNTVIPFLPKDNPLPKRNMPLHLRSLVPLDECSPLFPKKVRNTFSCKRIEEQRRIWNQEQERLDLENQYLRSQEEIRHVRDRAELIQRNNQQINRLLSQIPSCWPSTYPSFSFPNPVPSQVPLPGQAVPYPGLLMTQPPPQQPWPNCISQSPTVPQLYLPMPVNVPYPNPGFQPTGPGGANPYAQHMLNPHLFNSPMYPQQFWQAQGNPSLASANLSSQSSGAPVIQIQNATNVQIGDGNQMRIAGNTEDDDGSEREEEEEEEES